VKVSIITAVFNGGSQIEDSLRSVASQIYAPIEHIVVDGASTDGTLDVVRRQTTQVARIISEPDDGVYDAFNKGLRAASGDVIGFLGCGDTYCGASTIATIAEKFSDPTVDAVFGDLVIVNKDQPESSIRRYRSKYFTPGRMAYGFMPAHPTLFLRKQLYERIGGYSTQYEIASDFELCLRAFVKTPTHYIYIPQILVRMLSGGLSNSGWKSKATITREMKRACIANGIRTSSLRLYSRFPFKLLEMVAR
jgi:glycosyltransferase involved in cell wall biosynthesis